MQSLLNGFILRTVKGANRACKLLVESDIHPKSLLTCSSPPSLVQYTPLGDRSLTTPSEGSLAPPITMQWTRNTEQVMQQTYHSP